MEGVIPDLSDQITRLIHYLEELKNLTGYVVGLQAEISNFMRILTTNLAYLNTSLPHAVSTDAIGLLANEVAEANRFMGECLQQDKFKKIWSAREVHTTLESLRLKLVSCFHLAFFITSLDVIIEGQHRASDFQQRMLNLYFTHVSDALAARGQLQTLLQPLASETLEKLIEFLKRGGVASTGIATDESIDTENFFADVLATVEQLHPPELEWLDPDGSSSGSNHDDSSGSSEAGREASTGPSLSLWLAKSPKSSSSPRTEIVAAGEPTFSSQSNVVACVGEDSSTQRDLEAGTGASLESRLDHDNDDDCVVAIFAFICSPGRAGPGRVPTHQQNTSVIGTDKGTITRLSCTQDLNQIWTSVVFVLTSVILSRDLIKSFKFCRLQTEIPAHVTAKRPQTP
ncbi:hypothetical protein R1sor_025770 [Riccia sorocarpa]|uniref:Uncharacterized protein n=1 Tax=Riccia sorocarpa TaxID=122646 RepID=A0ABD3GB63_9MARC